MAFTVPKLLIFSTISLSKSVGLIITNESLSFNFIIVDCTKKACLSSLARKGALMVQTFFFF